jgi:hypothetical protein
VFWLGASLPVLNWLSFSLIAYFHLTARALTGPWFFLFLALAFWLGSVISLRPLVRGLAIGLSVSSVVAVGQWIGCVPIDSYNLPAGLLYNGSIQAAAIALVITALVCDRDWRFVPALLPGLLLTQSRGGFLVLAIGLSARAFGWLAPVFMVAVAAVVSLAVMNISDVHRLLIWNATWNDLEWLGHGAGSFANVLFWHGDDLHYPGHVHNDYLQLAYELGIWAAPVYLVYAAALIRAHSPYWPAFVGFAVAGLFFFPLYAPVTGFIGAVLAGHIACDHDGVKFWKTVNAAV